MSISTPNSLQRIAQGEDACGRHSPAYYHKTISELRDSLANAHGLIQAQQARISELEHELAMYRKTRTAEVLTPAGEQKSWPRYQP